MNERRLVTLWLPLVVSFVAAGCTAACPTSSSTARTVTSDERGPGLLQPRAASASQERDAGAKPRVVPLSVAPRMPAAARTYVDGKDRLRVKLPAGWYRATDRATDRLSLVESTLLAVGTFRIRPRPKDACSDDAGEPRVDVGPTEALVVLEEDVRARAELARKRPRFRLLKQVAPPGKPRRARTAVFPAWNCRNQVGVSGLWEPSFADGGRVFSVTAIICKAVTAKTRSEALAVLNSLKPLEDQRR